MDLHLTNRTAVVAGSSAGLGRACAAALAGEGARVVINGRDADRLAATAASLAGTGATVVPVVADVSTAAGATELVDSARELVGDIDILVANAGGPPPGTFASTSYDAYGDALELNLLSTVAMCQAAVPEMRERGWGRVVAITSIGARQPVPTLIASVTARAGVTGFLKVLAGEVGPDGVTVNSLQPGLHTTDRLAQLHASDLDALRADIPTRSLGDPADFGAVAAWLCSDQARFITGAAIPVDGGASRALM